MNSIKTGNGMLLRTPQGKRKSKMNWWGGGKFILNRMDGRGIAAKFTGKKWHRGMWINSPNYETDFFVGSLFRKKAAITQNRRNRELLQGGTILGTRGRGGRSRKRKGDKCETPGKGENSRHLVVGVPAGSEGSYGLHGRGQFPLIDGFCMVGHQRSPQTLEEKGRPEAVPPSRRGKKKRCQPRFLSRSGRRKERSGSDICVTKGRIEETLLLEEAHIRSNVRTIVEVKKGVGREEERMRECVC